VEDRECLSKTGLTLRQVQDDAEGGVLDDVGDGLDLVHVPVGQGDLLFRGEQGSTDVCLACLGDTEGCCCDGLSHPTGRDIDTDLLVEVGLALHLQVAQLKVVVICAFGLLGVDDGHALGESVETIHGLGVVHQQGADASDADFCTSHCHDFSPVGLIKAPRFPAQ